jgi:ABC-2 type transport system permease protein
MRSFLWSKFWTGLVPVLVVAEALTIASNYFLGAAPFLRALGAVAIFFMTFALVGLATGMGAIYPRFNAENLTQVAGSYGGIGYMVLAVLFILVEVSLLGWSSSIRLWHEYRGIRIPPAQVALMVSLLLAAVAVAITTFWTAMQRGIRALEALGR